MGRAESPSPICRGHSVRTWPSLGQPGRSRDSALREAKGRICEGSRFRNRVITQRAGISLENKFSLGCGAGRPMRTVHSRSIQPKTGTVAAAEIHPSAWTRGSVWLAPSKLLNQPIAIAIPGWIRACHFPGLSESSLVCPGVSVGARIRPVSI